MVALMESTARCKYTRLLLTPGVGFRRSANRRYSVLVAGAQVVPFPRRKAAPDADAKP
jgi:hypothetical protein